MQIFPGLEADSFAWGYGDFGTGARVASDAGFARLDGEDAEAAKLDAVALHEALFHGFEDGIDCRFGFGADEAGTVDDALNEILLDQWAPVVNG